MSKIQYKTISNYILVIIGVALILTSMLYRANDDVLVDEAGNEISQADASYVKTDLEGKLIAVTADVLATETLKDSYFNISKQSYKLKRVVETYQWKQVCDPDCSYNKVWSEELIDSSEYDANYKNPETKAFSSEEYMKTGVSFGSYELTDVLLHSINYDTVMGPDEMANAYNGNYTLVGEYITNSEDIDNAKIGDFRISYHYAKDKTMTVIAKQNGNSFSPYYTSDKKEIYTIEEGEISAKDYVASFNSTASSFRIIIALVGIAFTCFGLTSLFLEGLRKKKQK